MNISSKFIHTTKMENLKLVQAQELADLFVKVFKPKSVIDIGCGTGSILGALKQRSILVLGFDGKWVSEKLLLENINEDEFVECDLEQHISYDKKSDILLCLEVAEHLREQRADGLIEDLTSMSDVIIFSAAIPGQGGQNHINEQWPLYWKEKFQNNGFWCQDVLKSHIWNNPKILWWYRQNILVFTRDKNYIFPQELNLKFNSLENVIHPDLFTTIVNHREKNAVKRHLKLFIKAVLYKLKMIGKA